MFVQHSSVHLFSFFLFGSQMHQNAVQNRKKDMIFAKQFFTSFLKMKSIYFLSFSIKRNWCADLYLCVSTRVWMIFIYLFFLSIFNIVDNWIFCWTIVFRVKLVRKKNEKGTRSSNFKCIAATTFFWYDLITNRFQCTS